MDEECERELEKAVERQIGEQRSRMEQDWDIHKFMIEGDVKVLLNDYSLYDRVKFTLMMYPSKSSHWHWN